ncbi:MAG: hypothetical protein DIU78_024355 [Pseudomonadota bacterium]
MRRVWLLGVLLAAGCAIFREDLNRGQRLYEENQYERALAVFRALESDMDSLSTEDRARYAYLRGMTDYRLGFREEARHWLGIALAIDTDHAGSLSPEWNQRLQQALDDLNNRVYGLEAPENRGGDPTEGAQGVSTASSGSTTTETAPAPTPPTPTPALTPPAPTTPPPAAPARDVRGESP